MSAGTQPTDPASSLTQMERDAGPWTELFTPAPATPNARVEMLRDNSPWTDLFYGSATPAPAATTPTTGADQPSAAERTTAQQSEANRPDSTA